MTILSSKKFIAKYVNAKINDINRVCFQPFEIRLSEKFLIIFVLSDGVDH